MQVKILEVRDRGTMFAVIAIDMNPALDFRRDALLKTDGHNEAQRYHLRRVGYPCDGEPNIAITHLSAGGQPCWNDPYGWGGRTYPVAHNYIIENWKTLADGDVIDVEFILGETAVKKISERLSVPI
jgi:hypothetical protein